MLRISKLADYGTVILTHMAKTPQTRMAAPKLAAATYISVPMVSKILKMLANANLLTSTRGANGGYALALSPEQIAITDIITALDGDMALTACTSHDENCDLKTICHIRANWQVINTAIYRTLNGITLADMVMPMPANQFIDTSALTNKLNKKGKR